MSPVFSNQVPALVDLLDSLAFVAVEHGESLDLARFVNLVDLYARHLEAGDGLPFEDFVRDGTCLGEAADAAERTSGVPTAAPAALGGERGAVGAPCDESLAEAS